MRTKTEIETEIAALRALKPVGVWKYKTARSLALIVEELTEGIDDTAVEWGELDEDQQYAVLHARRWKEGTSNEKSSQDWGLLVE